MPRRQWRRYLSFATWGRFLRANLHPSACFYAAVWGVIGGVGLTLATNGILANSWVWLVVVGVLVGLACWQARRFLLVPAFLAGLLLANFRLSFDLAGQARLASLAGHTVTISGTISEDPDVSKGNTVVRLQSLVLEWPEGEAQESVAGTLYVQLSGSDLDLERSDRLTLNGKLGTGFGTFAGTFYRPTVQGIARASTGDLFARFKQWFASLTRQYIPSPEVELGLGYLMGQKSGLPESLSAALVAVGMTHMVVASGAHLGILVNAAKRLVGRLSRFAGLLAALLLIAAFVLIVGFTPSMTRAALVASLSLLCGYVGRKFTPLRLIAFTAALTLLFTPLNLLNLGWQLSFASFFGILVLAPAVTRLLYGGKNPLWLASMFVTSLCTSFTCAPILIYNFGSISFLSLVANLLILPTLPYAMLLMLLTGSFSWLPPLAGLIGQLTTWLLDLHILIVNFLSTQTMFILELPTGDARVFLLYIPLILALLCYNIRYGNRVRGGDAQVWPAVGCEPQAPSCA